MNQLINISKDLRQPDLPFVCNNSKVDGSLRIDHIPPEVLNQSQSIVFIFLLALGFYLGWNLFLRPFDLSKDFTEYGFDDVTTTKNVNNVRRQKLINEMRRRRKIGELPPSFPNGWFAIIESDTLKQNSCQEVFVFGETLVAWRGESGKAYVAEAYCPHLGANLAVGGKITKECITCPFHGWAFDGEKQGKLTSIPYASRVADFIKLRTWKTFETNGFIFAWYHAEKEEPTWFPDEVDEINSGKWIFNGRSDFKVACHIQEIPENGADVSHLNVVHTSAFICGDKPEKSLFSWKFIKHIWSAKWMPNPDQKRSYEALLTMSHHLVLFNSLPFFHINLEVHQTGPGIVFLHFDTIFGKGVLIQTVTPIEPLLQKITHRFYTSSRFIYPIGKMILHGEACQIARDISIWNRKCFLNKPILTKEDQQIKTFRRWFSQFYSENSPRHYVPKENGVHSNTF